MQNNQPDVQHENTTIYFYILNLLVVRNCEYVKRSHSRRFCAGNEITRCVKCIRAFLCIESRAYCAHVTIKQALVHHQRPEDAGDSEQEEKQPNTTRHVNNHSNCHETTKIKAVSRNQLLPKTGEKSGSSLQQS